MRLRGLASASAAAVLLSVPALAQIRDQDRPNFNTSVAFITLNTQVTPSVKHPLRVVLRQYQSDNWCDVDNIVINDQHFPWGRGEGPLFFDNDVQVSARWGFMCSSQVPGAILNFTVTALDGEPLLHEAGFIAHLRTDTVELISISSPDAYSNVPVNYFGNDKNEWLLENIQVVSEGISEEIEDIYRDWEQILEEEIITIEEIEWQPDSEVDQDETPDNYDQSPEVATSETSSPPQQDESTQGHQDHHFEVLVDPASNTKMKPLTSTGDSPSPLSITSTPTPTARFMPSLSPPDQDLVMTLTIAAAAFSLFSIIGIIAGTRRLAPHIQRRPRQRETREERLARVAERRRAVRKFFSALFCGLFGHDEKIDKQARQGRDLRGSGSAGGTQSHESGDTTMEQELAGLRNAADMVSNLIAAEEGRHNHFLQQQWSYQQQGRGERDPAPPAVPDPIRAAYPGYNPGYNPGELTPPSYENDAVDTSMVADGFRYTPGGTELPPSSNIPSESGGGVQGTSNSDRLGYGNKD